ncbi:hypothetical protein [Paludibacterium yongneupense]|uniref:hypothetical protein n=1 Tax=Paludibacterium yongneupense TaxID=400061 RepID=UPI0004095B3A|nr:hypothetical protein [Paludibacterium yongneupense]
MPYALIDANGHVDALLGHAVAQGVFLPATDPRVLDLLLAGDRGAEQRLLDASDNAQHFLLDSLLLALAESRLLAPDDIESLADSHPGVRPMRLHNLRERVESDEDAARQSLRESDPGAVRLIEDVIDVLEKKGLLHQTDLPQGAQTLLRLRRELRAYLSDDEADESGPD